MLLKESSMPHRIFALTSSLIIVGLAITSPAVAQGSLSPDQREILAKSEKVGESLLVALGKSDRVSVIITFNVPELRALQAGGLQGRDLDTAAEAIKEVGDYLLSSLSPGELEVRHRFQSVSAIAGVVQASALPRLIEKPQVVHVDLDDSGGGSLVESRALTHIDQVHARGYTGVGVVSAILDSGIDTAHFDLSDDLIAQQCFCGPNCCPNGTSQQSGAGSAADNNGHGTNVAGILTSKGTIAPKGAAPNTKIVAIKVLDSLNQFQNISDIVAGLDWIINNRPDVKVVNMSLGTNATYSGACDSSYLSLAQAINTLRARNTVVFASAGNNALNSQMQSPACIANTIAVGAVYDANVGSFSTGVCSDATTAADKMACFSNRSSSIDLFAPGALVTSTGLGNTTSTYAGTSQASPMVAACSADLLQANPTLTANGVETALKGTTARVTDPTNSVQYPRLDCEQSLALATACTPSATRMCLNSNRFSVTVSWTTGSSNGAGQVASCGTADSGLFWFFNSTNWEMLVKVLNGCGVNSRYWVFSSVTTNVGWTMTVTDTLTGAVKTYTNPNGTTANPILDTNAFATCP
jgi:Subtilase family